MNNFKKSVLFDTYKIAMKNRSKLLQIFLFDILFIIVLVIYGKLANVMFPDTMPSVTSIIAIFATAFGLTLLNLLIIILIYSFFKFHVIRLVSQLFSEKTRLLSFPAFYGLNLLLFVPFFLLAIVLLFLLALVVRQEYLQNVGGFVVFIVFLLGYSAYNFAHTFFVQGYGFKSFQKSINLITKRHKYYFPIIGVSLFIFFAVILILYVLVWLLGDVLRIGFFQYNMQAVFIVSFIILILMLYKIIHFNRLYFFNMLKKHGEIK